MKLVSFSRDNAAPRPGILRDGKIVDLSAEYKSTEAFIEAGAAALTSAKAMSPAAAIDLDSVTLHAPLANPPRIFCIGLNYRDHAEESNMQIPKVPVVFMKLASALIGPDAAIQLPAATAQPDYEAELAVVIGKPGKYITAADWEDYVFGYTILNDVSARDVQLATSQWTLGKSFETFAPLGPCIVTKDEIPDPHNLAIKLAINGETLQQSNTKELIFRIPDLLAHLSNIVTLLPGDIISTGTPAGVGLGRKPPRWLKGGDDIVIDIDSIGTLHNPVKS